MDKELTETEKSIKYWKEISKENVEKIIENINNKDEK